jgi:hypothetical protein
MNGQLLFLQAANLNCPPTQLELETELGTPKNSDRNRSLSSRGAHLNARMAERGLAEVHNELHNFQDSVKGELDDVKAMIKQLLLEVQKWNTGRRGVSPTSYEVGTIDIEDAMTHELEPGEQIVAMHDPICLPLVPTQNAEAVFVVAVADASLQVRLQYIACKI